MSDKFTQHEWLDMFSALDSTTRFNILIFLNNEGEKTVEQISDMVNQLTRQNYNWKSQRWINAYINPLLTKGLIDYSDRPNYKKFDITQKGKDVLDIILVTKVRSDEK